MSLSVHSRIVAARARYARGDAAEFAGPAGPLEAVISTPPAPATDTVAIICHPHPLHGGTLDNKITHTLARSCCALGATAVRFNFRGVGRSAGVYDRGDGETEDLLAVAAEVRRRHPHAALWLAGFSFGAYVALRASQRLAVDRLITVAPPVNLYEVDGLAAPDCPWLLVQGTADELVPYKAVLRWAGRLCPAPEAVYLDGVDHYFHGRLNALHTLLIERITAHPPQRRAAGLG